MEFFGMPLGKWIVEIIGGVIAAIAAVVGWLFRRDQANKKKFDELAAQAVQMKKDHDNEMKQLYLTLIRLEEKVKSLPGETEITRIFDRLEELSQTTHELSGTVTATNTTLQLINQHLINEGNKK